MSSEFWLAESSQKCRGSKKPVESLKSIEFLESNSQAPRRDFSSDYTDPKDSIDSTDIKEKAAQIFISCAAVKQKEKYEKLTYFVRVGTFSICPARNGAEGLMRFKAEISLADEA